MGWAVVGVVWVLFFILALCVFVALLDGSALLLVSSCAPTVVVDYVFVLLFVVRRMNIHVCPTTLVISRGEVEVHIPTKI